MNLRSERGVFRLRLCDVDRRADLHQCEKFWRGFAFQPDAAMASRMEVDKALMKTIGRSEFTPIAHWITDIVTGDVRAGLGWYDPITLDPKSVRS